MATISEAVDMADDLSPGPLGPAAGSVPTVWVSLPQTLTGPVRDLLAEGLWRLQARNGGRVHPALEEFVRQLHQADQQPPTRPVPHTEPAPARTPILITVAVKAREMGCSREYVRRLARAGRLPAHRQGRDWLIEVKEEDTHAIGTGADRG